MAPLAIQIPLKWFLLFHFKQGQRKKFAQRKILACCISWDGQDKIAATCLVVRGVFTNSKLRRLMPRKKTT